MLALHRYRFAVVLATVVVSVLLPAGLAGAAVIAVTTISDEYSAVVNACSLREAVQAANSNMPYGGCHAGSGADEITLPAGTHGFTRSGGEAVPDVSIGDLDVDGALTIVGQGNPTINGNDLDRIFQLTNGDSLILRGLTLTNGMALTGGAIWVQSGTLSLVDVVVDLNAATSAMGQSAFGGGIWAQISSVSIAGSRITNNIVTSADPVDEATGGSAASAATTSSRASAGTTSSKAARATTASSAARARTVSSAARARTSSP